MLYALLLWAQEEGGGTPFWYTLLLWVPIIWLFYFLLIRPNVRERQERLRLISTLKKNDEVLTASGIYGVVVNIKDKEDEVVLKIDDASNARLRVLKSSIIRIMNPKEPPRSG